MALDRSYLISEIVRFEGMGQQHLLTILPITKIKVGDFEVEFDHVLNALQEKIEASESSPSSLPESHSVLNIAEDATWQEFFSEYRKILDSPSSNLDKLVSAAILIERMLSSVAIAFKLDPEVARRGASSIMRELSKQQLVNEEEFEAFQAFWQIRNQVVHGTYGELTNAQTARVLDMGWRLVRALA